MSESKQLFMDSSLKIIFIGDISLNDEYSTMYQEGAKPFQSVEQIMMNCDFVIGNLECLLQGSQGENTLRKPRLHTDSNTINYLKDINLGLACLANNHVYDNLDDGFSNTEYDLFAGEHDGYARLTDPVIHHRKIHLNKLSEEIVITDQLSGKAIHDVEIFFHFDAGVDFTITDKNEVVTCLENEPNLTMFFDHNTNFTLEKLESWVSKKYGHKERSKSLKVVFSGIHLPFVFNTTIRFISV